MPNYMHPEAVRDILDALLATAPGLSAAAQQRLRRLLWRHVHGVEHEAIPVQTLPASAPAWAEGKRLAHFLPSRELQTDVRHVGFLVLQAEQELEAGDLAASDPALANSLQTLIDSLPHRTWPELVRTCRPLTDDLLLWRSAQTRCWSRKIVRVGRRRRWRRLRSGQELWEAASGTTWCVRKGESLSRRYIKALRDRACALWVLEEGARALALAWHDPVDREIVEVKDRGNEPPIRYRQAVAALARHLGVMQSQAPDMRALVLDGGLGKVSDAFWTGELRSKFTDSTLTFRLWADGRRRTYLLGVREDAKRPWFFLRLAVADGAWRLDGLAPSGWRGSLEALMKLALRKVARVDGRLHWRAALDGLRCAGS